MLASAALSQIQLVSCLAGQDCCHWQLVPGPFRERCTSSCHVCTGGLNYACLSFMMLTQASTRSWHS